MNIRAVTPTKPKSTCTLEVVCLPSVRLRKCCYVHVGLCIYFHVTTNLISFCVCTTNQHWHILRPHFLHPISNTKQAQAIKPASSCRGTFIFHQEGGSRHFVVIQSVTGNQSVTCSAFWSVYSPLCQSIVYLERTLNSTWIQSWLVGTCRKDVVLCF